MRFQSLLAAAIVLALAASSIGVISPAATAWSAASSSYQTDSSDPAAVPGFSEQNDQKGAALREPYLPVSVQAIESTYGYTLNTDAAYNWIDAAQGGTVVNFPNQDSENFYVDDDVAGPIPLNFSFKFFEFSYSEIFISSNGLLTFGDGDRSYRNVDIPRDELPNAYIAPFWDDLVVGGSATNSRVYYKYLDNPNRFVVEWRNVNRRSTTPEPLITFQAILYADTGNILFQYKTMAGTLDQATAGIEDSDGRDGLRYLYNEPGAASGKAVSFTRPAPSARVKTLPAAAGEFAINGPAVFSLIVRNTGDTAAATDRYNLITELTNPSWQAALYHSNGSTLLQDSNSDGYPDTPALEKGASTTVIVKLIPVQGASSGDWTHLTITARSINDPAKSQSSLFQAAVPSPFAIAYTDEETGFRLGLFSKSSAIHPRLENDRWFSGNTLAVAAMPNGSYVYAWQSGLKNLPYQGLTAGPLAVDFTDIEYMFIGRFGAILRSFVKLTDNSSAALPTHDNFPALAVAPSGEIGIIWIRTILRSDNKTNSNVYFALLKPNGDVLMPPTNITNNTGWRGTGDLNIPIFSETRLDVTPNGRFLLTWSARVIASVDPNGDDLEKSDIWIAAYSTQGNQEKSPAKITSSVPQTAYYKNPVVIGLQDNRSIVAYTLYNLDQNTETMVMTGLDAGLNKTISERVIPGGMGWRAGGTQLSSGKILLAWTNASNGAISYTLMDNNESLSYEIGVQDMVVPDFRQVDFLSVTRDPFGNGIITWMDAVWNNHFYYALIDSSGQQKTPAMFFYSSQNPAIALITSDKGQGLAYYEGAYRVHLPVSIR
jgi:hypothetical protein